MWASAGRSSFSLFVADGCVVLIISRSFVYIVFTCGWFIRTSQGHPDWLVNGAASVQMCLPVQPCHGLRSNPQIYVCTRRHIPWIILRVIMYFTWSWTSAAHIDRWHLMTRSWRNLDLSVRYMIHPCIESLNPSILIYGCQEIFGLMDCYGC